MDRKGLFVNYELLDFLVVSTLKRPGQFSFVALLAIYLSHASLHHLGSYFTIADAEIDHFDTFLFCLNKT